MSLPAQEPFSDLESFDRAFGQGLEEILQQGSLGAFILACANANGQAELYQVLAVSLRERYRLLKAEFEQGASVDGGEEDRVVFGQLLDIGLDQLPPAESRPCGDWQLQFNAMRAFRPMRHAASAPETLHQPFNAAGFHFNKPFMLEERFWEGRAYGHSLTAYYNKYPFADYHLLWLPDRENEMPQFLQPSYHELMWRLCDDLAQSLPDFAMGYNALGAFASVNHLHFQSFVGEKLPIMSSHWRHHGGDKEYPLQCYLFDSPQESWRFIEELHAMNQAYNLLYTKGLIYCIPRANQGARPAPEWTPGFAWREVCGDMVTVRRDDYDSLRDDEISNSLQQIRVSL